MDPADTLLSIEGLVTTFPAGAGTVAAVDGLDLSLAPGGIVGLVGESGSGKSMTALSILGLVPPPGKVAGGRILYRGEDLVTAPAGRLRDIRGAHIAMIFQEPMTSLNPVFTVGRQVSEGILAHQDLPKAQALERSREMLSRVGIPEPGERLKSYPHQLSGGMRQRVMIAMALAMNPRLLLADEPTTALDVTIQAQVLVLMRKLQEETGTTLLLITHDLAVVAQMAQRVAVMYTGRLMEEAPVGELFKSPLHPYTRGLLACLPSRSASRGKTLSTIPGTVPALTGLPRGCKFSDRCPEAFAPCHEAEPALAGVAPDHRVRCFLHHREIRKPRAEAA